MAGMGEDRRQEALSAKIGITDIPDKGLGMQRTRVLAIGLMLFATSCQRDGGIVGHARLPGVAGTFVIEDDDRTVALASVQHSVFYQLLDERKLVFKGAGGDLPHLSLVGPTTILLRYCRGSIYSVESSFFDDPNATDDLRIVRLQAVTEPACR
jgi:hypothetical protein